MKRHEGKKVVILGGTSGMGLATAKMLQGIFRRDTDVRRHMDSHNLVMNCLAAAYLSANVYAIVKMRVFDLARSRKHLLLYGAPFILWGSLILLGCKLMEIMCRFDEWAA